MENHGAAEAHHPVAGRLNRSPAAGEHELGQLCSGLQSVEEIRELLRQRHLDESFVTGTKVLVDDTRDFYMYVDDKDRRLVACLSHIKDSDPRIVYLDYLHELVHIFQLHDGRNLYDRRFKYVRRTTEIEAYAVAVREGKRMGMAYTELAEYLRVEWISDDEHMELIRAVGLQPPATA